MVSQLHAIDGARGMLHLTFKQIARILQADESTLQRWKSGISQPSPIFVSRLESLEELLTELRATFRETSDVQRWLSTRVPAFNNQRPIDLLLDGRIERVSAGLLAFNTGMAT